MILKDYKAYLVGKIMGDGHLEKTLGSCYFISEDKKELQRLKKKIISWFPIDKARCHIKKEEFNKGTSYKLRINNVKFCREMYSLGAPKGKKTEHKFLVPTWILSKIKYQKKFLQGILEDELTTIKIEKKNHSVRPQFKMAKNTKFLNDHYDFMNQVKNMLISFSVNCSEVKEVGTKSEINTHDLYFSIKRNKRSIIKFKEHIGFGLNKRKQSELENCCKILKNTLRPEVNKEKLIFFKKRGLSIRQIARKTGISRSYVHRLLQKYKNEGLF
tara:strand:+ start:316 stop:1131 length:816 start_codon:yes stop_codon:yes gene_type:complete